VDLSIAGDGEATLPALIAAVRRALGSSRKSALSARRAKIEQMHRDMREKSRIDASHGWDARPISTARMYMELWNQLAGEDWALVSEALFQSFWPHRLWPIDKHYQFIGGSGGYGIGYQAPAAVGAALGHRSHGRLCINIQGDGDLMCVPGVLWTAAHHKIPLLTIMHNNRSYHQEVMHVQRMALRRDRGVDRFQIGNEIDNPAIDFAKVAQGLGLWASGPITDPAELGPAIKRAIAVVKAGEPALLDVVSQPR
jgi:thiamine pyrophosphate-dependent acetolactate synthase large subunit-like protein